MTSTTFFIVFIPILAVLLLAINLILAPHNPYQEKDSAFECGFHSFLGQNRTQFSVSFFIFGLLFLLFDLEILLVYPYSVSSYTNDIYGLVIMMVFFVLLTLGFIFELGKNALTIDSRQTSSYNNVDTTRPAGFIKSAASQVLYALGINLENFVYNVPSANKLRRLGNEDLSQISAKANEYSSKILEYRDAVIQQANLELARPNLSGESTTEITRYITDANTAADAGVRVLGETLRLIIENGAAAW